MAKVPRLKSAGTLPGWSRLPGSYINRRQRADVCASRYGTLATIATCSVPDGCEVFGTLPSPMPVTCWPHGLLPLGTSWITLRSPPARVSLSWCGISLQLAPTDGIEPPQTHGFNVALYQLS